MINPVTVTTDAPIWVREELARRERTVNAWYDGLVARHPDALRLVRMTRENYVAAQLELWNKCVPLTWTTYGSQEATAQ